MKRYTRLEQLMKWPPPDFQECFSNNVIGKHTGEVIRTVAVEGAIHVDTSTVVVALTNSTVAFIDILCTVHVRPTYKHKPSILNR